MELSPSKYPPFSRDEVQTVKNWWEGFKKFPGDSARLRRCHTPGEVAFEPSYHRLIFQLGESGSSYPDRIAVIAGVISHIRTDSSAIRFAVQMGSKKDSSNNPYVSGLRFRRLIQNQEREDLYEPLIRIVHLMGNTANVADLTNGIYWWNEKTKKNWAFLYYETAPSAE